jgi:hypothetical protein
VMLCAWLPIPRSVRAGVLACLMAGEMAGYFLVPILSLPSQGTIDLTGIRFLQANLGLQRFATLGPISPNYGSYFGIASVNHNDLPIPKVWSDFVVKRLDSNTPSMLFTGTTRQNQAGPSAAAALIDNLSSYAAVGVRYVVLAVGQLESPGFSTFRQYLASPSAQLHEVHHDDFTQIFELSNPVPYVSAPGCTVTPASHDAMTVDCAASSRLTRLETYMPGWRARIDNLPAPVRPDDTGLFQQIDLPPGKSTVEFRFVPPYMTAACVLLLLGLMLFLADLYSHRKRPGASLESPVSRIAD